MTLKERIESRVEFRKIRLGRKTAFTASAFIDGVLYETTKATKELCVADLVRKAERKDGIHADSIPPCPAKPMNDYNEDDSNGLSYLNAECNPLTMGKARQGGARLCYKI